MSITDIINTVPDSIKKTFNKIQKLNRKLSKAKTAVLFNDICLKENILPKYSDVKLHDHRAKKQPFTETFRRNLVEHQLNQKQTQVSELQQKVDALNKKLRV